MTFPTYGKIKNVPNHQPAGLSMMDASPPILPIHRWNDEKKDFPKRLSYVSSGPTRGLNLI